MPCDPHGETSRKTGLSHCVALARIGRFSLQFSQWKIRRRARQRGCQDLTSREAALRIAIVGLGDAGRHIHLPAIDRLSGVELAGACDPDPHRRTPVASAHDIPVFSSIEELLDQQRPDLVVVASPPALHALHCRLAFEHGAHVLCEKPLAGSVAEAEEVLARAVSAGRHVAVNHEFRAMPIFRSVIHAVRNAGEGSPLLVQAWQLIDADPAREEGWRGRLRRRTLYEAGGHLVDLILALFAESPTSVGAVVNGSTVDATVLVTLEFSRGRLAHIMQSRRHTGDRQYLEVRAETPSASYRASFGGRARVSAGLERSTRPHVRFEWGRSGIAWKEEGTRRTTLARNPPEPLVAATANSIGNYVDVIRDKQPVPQAAEDGLLTLRVIAAAYLAADLGRNVTLEGADAERAASILLSEERRQ